MSDMSQNLSIPNTEDAKLLQDVKQGKPLDFSFKFLKTLSRLKNEKPRALRLHGVPHRGLKRKFISAAIWLNNNRLAKLNGLIELADVLYEFPTYLTWIDVSFNELTRVDQEILHFKNLKILYLHGNRLKDMEEVMKLRNLPQLQSLTLYGNPLSRINNYRRYVLAYLPQIQSLDISRITRQERSAVVPTGCLIDQ